VSAFLPSILSLWSLIHHSSWRPFFYFLEKRIVMALTDCMVLNLADRAKGAVGNVRGALVGDREDQARYQEIHDKGLTQQRRAEQDIQKQADA
jgi:hypothetical protein